MFNYTVPMRVTNFTAVQNVETNVVMIAWSVSICTCSISLNMLLHYNTKY